MVETEKEVPAGANKEDVFMLKDRVPYYYNV